MTANSTPEALIENYREVAKLFERLRYNYRADTDGDSVRMECTIRLEQCWFALRAFRARQSARDFVSGFDDAFTTPRFYGEAFYFFAWRFARTFRSLRILDTATGQITQPFKTFESKGIRIVRNQMMEHPEDNGVIVDHVMIDDAHGMVMQPIVSTNASPLDSGLYANAKELIEKVSDLLLPLGYGDRSDHS